MPLGCLAPVLLSALFPLLMTLSSVLTSLNCGEKYLLLCTPEILEGLAAGVRGVDWDRKEEGASLCLLWGGWGHSW